jgi:hypothetical protein
MRGSTQHDPAVGACCIEASSLIDALMSQLTMTAAAEEEEDGLHV